MLQPAPSRPREWDGQLLCRRMAGARTDCRLTSAEPDSARKEAAVHNHMEERMAAAHMACTAMAAGPGTDMQAAGRDMVAATHTPLLHVGLVREHAEAEPGSTLVQAEQLLRGAAAEARHTLQLGQQEVDAGPGEAKAALAELHEEPHQPARQHSWQPGDSSHPSGGGLARCRIPRSYQSQAGNSGRRPRNMPTRSPGVRKGHQQIGQN
mmetsp:Transcript_9003/g.21007  ORF Transcript_9003/g.21007 Transcript_9003/m.21007 type:complete len:209 (-) Transcript_9003:946-1572(-)